MISSHIALCPPCAACLLGKAALLRAYAPHLPKGTLRYHLFASLRLQSRHRILLGIGANFIIKRNWIYITDIFVGGGFLYAPHAILTVNIVLCGFEIFLDNSC